jgi:2-polyprenyl-6-methoxyphenol hydroxylase-like FAD-dependent oxidoreductase
VTNTADTAVLIAGAGPTGLALACDLARRSVPFRLVDKAPAYFAGSRGKGLQPRTLEVLDDFGLIDEILSSGRFHLAFRAYDGSKILGERDLHEGRHPTPDVPYASTLMIPQWRVEEILRNKLQSLGGRVELATELTAFHQDDERVTATLTHDGTSEQVTAGYLVGADGGHSFVRKALGVGFEGETWTSERMLVGDVRTDSLNRDFWHSWPNGPGGWVALCPFAIGDSFQFQAQIAPDEPDEPSLERFQQIVDERTGDMGIRLRDATWLSLYRANVRMVDRYRVGRVFLAGDAAHVHSPAGGQGMNTGIQDAYNLGWKLSQVWNGASAALLDTYEEERLPVAAWMLGVTSRLHRSMSAHASDQRRGPETLQLGINYRESSLARDDRENPGTLRAGDRAPDSPTHDAAGNPVRLFDLFRGPHFTLLAFGSANIDRDYGPLVHTHAIADTEAYDVHSPALVLVRPDGYIGLITESQSLAAVEQYLKSVNA